MYIDVLTGLYTRKHCLDYISRQWKHCIDNKLPFSLGIADIDFFKRVNDTYGHQEGDRVLNSVANVMKNALPEDNNYVARMGGEEFYLILVGEPKDRVTNIIEGTCLAVANNHIVKPCEEPGQEQEIKVTISIGGSTIVPSPRDSVDAFTAIADQMLYKAKGNGRNQVVWI